MRGLEVGRLYSLCCPGVGRLQELQSAVTFNWLLMPLYQLSLKEMHRSSFKLNSNILCALTRRRRGSRGGGKLIRDQLSPTAPHPQVRAAGDWQAMTQGKRFQQWLHTRAPHWDRIKTIRRKAIMASALKKEKKGCRFNRELWSLLSTRYERKSIIHAALVRFYFLISLVSRDAYLCLLRIRTAVVNQCQQT